MIKNFDNISFIENSITNNIQLDILNVIPSGLFIVDNSNIVNFVNKRALEILGYNADELLGKSCLKFACEPCKGHCGLNDSKIKKPIFNKTCTIRTKNGELKILKKNVSEIKDSNGNKIGGVESFDDITEQIEKESKLQILSQAVEASSSSIVITNKEGIIEYVNPYFEKLTGYSKQEAIGNNPRILKTGLQSDDYYKNLWETITSGNQWKGEFHNKKKNGDSYWESASISPVLDATNKITHFIAVKNDITQRKNSELFKTRLLSIIGHDLRGIFMNINGFANIIKSLNLSETNKNLDLSINQIIRSLNFGSELLENLVSWGKIQSNLISINPQLHNLKYSISNTITQLESCAKNKEITIENNIPSDIEFIFDDNMLNTIIRNLISNSIKFTSQGGIIKINGKKLGNQVEINISDNGVGMNKETAENLFTSQKAVTTLGTNKEKGTGLGLKICHDLVKLMNGKITVKSVENQGTTISILLIEDESLQT